MRKPDRSLVIVSAAVLSTLALCAAVSGNSFADAYNKILVSDQTGADNTYSGAVAPLHKTAPGQEPGYRGVMPGYVAPQPQVSSDKPEGEPPAPPRQHPMTTADKDPQMSYRPGYQPPHLPTADELRKIATLSGVQLNLQSLPAELAQNVHIRHKVYGLISGPQQRMDGMLPTEFAAKRTVDELMLRVNNPELSDDDRKQAVSAALSQLTNFDTYMRLRNNMPDGVYQALGAPKVFVDENREATANSDARLQDAIKQLREMQQ